MDYYELDGLDFVSIRLHTSGDHSTCAEYGGSCESDPSIIVEEQGARVAFVCPEHRVQRIVDPLGGVGGGDDRTSVRD